MLATHTAETFVLGELSVAHLVVGEDTLRIELGGSYLGRYDERFTNFEAHLAQLVGLAGQESITRVECHIDGLGELISRAQHAMYRMLGGMLPEVERIAVYVGDNTPEQQEHRRMVGIFAEQLGGGGGATLELCAPKKL